MSWKSVVFCEFLFSEGVREWSAHLNLAPLIEHSCKSFRLPSRAVFSGTDPGRSSTLAGQLERPP
jgi:hypothetical protein